MSCPEGYQRTNASRYRASNASQYQPPTRCSCTGVIVALIVVGILITIPSILGGGIVFLVFPIMFITQLTFLIGALIGFVFLVKMRLNRRNEGMLDDENE